MRAPLVLLVGLLCGVPFAEADPVFKCFDGKGRVVYQSQPCAATHLKAGGQIEAPPEASAEEVARIKADTARAQARLEARKKAEEEASAKAQQQEQEERRIQALERQAQAAEEQARAAERQARAAEEQARTRNVIVVPAHPAAHKPMQPRQPNPTLRCTPGDWRCK
jgi:alanyl-tRNA synthetase